MIQEAGREERGRRTLSLGSGSHCPAASAAAPRVPQTAKSADASATSTLARRRYFRRWEASCEEVVTSENA